MANCFKKMSKGFFAAQAPSYHLEAPLTQPVSQLQFPRVSQSLSLSHCLMLTPWSLFPNRGNVNRDKVGKREPVRKAHVDYTVASGPQKIQQLMGDEAEKLLKGRFAEVNVWQPLRVSARSL